MGMGDSVALLGYTTQLIPLSHLHPHSVTQLVVEPWIPRPTDLCCRLFSFSFPQPPKKFFCSVDRSTTLSASASGGLTYSKSILFS